MSGNIHIEIALTLSAHVQAADLGSDILREIVIKASEFIYEYHGVGDSVILVSEEDELWLLCHLDIKGPDSMLVSISNIVSRNDVVYV